MKYEFCKVQTPKYCIEKLKYFATSSLNYNRCFSGKIILWFIDTRKLFGFSPVNEWVNFVQKL